MSARSPHKIFTPSDDLWLQPVCYDLDAHRQFAKMLDENLAQLVAEHRTRQTRSVRPIVFIFGEDDATDPAEDVLPDQDIW